MAGKIRYYGCSNWRAPRIQAAQAYAAEPEFRGFVADQMQWSLAQLALSVTQLVPGYLLSQPFPTIPIVGCKTRAHLLGNLSATDVRLTPAQLLYLKSGARP